MSMPATLNGRTAITKDNTEIQHADSTNESPTAFSSHHRTSHCTQYQFLPSESELTVKLADSE
jgi:hypothetical protein